MVIARRVINGTRGARRAVRWVLYTRDRKRILGKFRTKKAALKRERQIIFFKHVKGKR